jgi:uncharacterized protein YbjQ (UPF0145 family)
MGFLDRLTGGGDGDDDAAQARREEQERSIRQIEAGGLPLSAEKRLRELVAAPQQTFTSTLAVGEFALSHGLGLQPICQVMGSTTYKVGFQWMPMTQSAELEMPTHAFNEARRLALTRLYKEAQLVGADAVVGVTIERSQRELMEDLVEFVAQGTAVRVPSTPTGGNPLLTDLDLDDYWKLRVAGYVPVGVVAASYVYYVVASRDTRKAMQGILASRRNQELVDFTQGVYTARESVLAALQAQAAYYRAHGIVGVSVDTEIREREANNNSRTDLVVTMHAIGTAIVAAQGGRAITPRPTVSIGANR